MKTRLCPFMLILIVLLSACAPSAERLATQTAEAASAAATRIASGPTPGLWKGSTDLEGYPGSVSFEVDADGNVRALHFVINFGLETGCIINAEKIEIKADRIFRHSFGEPNEGDANLIEGYFSSRTTIDGHISNLISCVTPAGESIHLFSSSRGSWHAKLSANE